MTLLRFRDLRVSSLTLTLVLLAGCGGAGKADIAALQETNAALEKRVAALEQAAATSALARSDAALAAALTVVQAVGRGQDPTLLSSEEQVAFCRATGWTIRDLAALGNSMRAAVIARDDGIRACRAAGIENPTEADVGATDPGKRWIEIVNGIGQVHRLMEAGQWAEAKKPFAPRPPAEDQ